MEVKLVTDYDSADFEIKVNEICKEYEGNNIEIDYKICYNNCYEDVHYTALIKITPKQLKASNTQIK